MQLLKMVFGFMLLCSLVLPLSTCTGVVEEGSTKQAERTERYIMSKDSSVSEWVWAFTFVVPFGVAVGLRKSTISIKTEAICLFSVLPASFVIWGHSATGRLASGGIAAILSIIFFILVTVICLTKVGSGKNKAPAAPPL